MGPIQESKRLVLLQCSAVLGFLSSFFEHSILYFFIIHSFPVRTVEKRCTVGHNGRKKVKYSLIDFWKNRSFDGQLVFPLYRVVCCILSTVLCSSPRTILQYILRESWEQIQYMCGYVTRLHYEKISHGGMGRVDRKCLFRCHTISR